MESTATVPIPITKTNNDDPTDLPGTGKPDPNLSTTPSSGYRSGKSPSSIASEEERNLLASDSESMQVDEDRPATPVHAVIDLTGKGNAKPKTPLWKLRQKSMWLSRLTHQRRINKALESELVTTRRNQYYWENPELRKKDPALYMSMENSEVHKERLAFGLTGPPPKLDPIQEEDITNEKGNHTVALLGKAILDLQEQVSANHDFAVEAIANVSYVANRAEATAMEGLRRTMQGCIELRGQDLENLRKVYPNPTDLFCHAVGKKYGVTIEKHEITQAFWSGPVVCAHFADMKPGSNYEKLTNRQKYFGGWAGRPEEKGFKVSIDRSKTNQERQIVSALTWLKELHRTKVAEGKMAKDKVALIRVKTLANGIAAKVAEDPGVPLLYVKSMTEAEALFQPEELEDFRCLMRQKKNASKARNKDRKKSQAQKRLTNANATPLGNRANPKPSTGDLIPTPSPAPQEPNPSPTQVPDPAAEQAERLQAIALEEAKKA